ncbi:NAD-dependent epimerase/dehydratase family protein [Herbiconiux ginsengi]|uniref:Nucleoside-diphosphate-sugar epimerase n=1 Tax=Herbiconiux ginsengi TaxID=381665 RepID=A0A1H3QH29_9MICO|nr:NAD-dependent epimerase/dehydratase family protein [Herbiconiux ginsengi]SDZ12315.1 Nucleoside-diphosphate-sugar epimerase [Herbiconiux ginsengi]
MAVQLVVGAGHIGGLLGRRLAERGDTVRVATRSGTAVDGCEAVTLDASDAAAFGRAAEGAATIFLVTNPPYWTWPTEWPPIFRAAIEAARTSGAHLVIMGNLYAYGPTRTPMREDSPLLTTETKGLVRKAGWLEAAAAAERGEIRVSEVRASDYFGPGVGGTNHLGSTFFGALRGSKTARVVGSPDARHSWSYLPDIVTALVAAADADATGPAATAGPATGAQAPGSGAQAAVSAARVWIVPSTTRTFREIAAEANALYGSHGKVAPWPRGLLRLIGVFSPLIREVRASSYQFADTFVVDSTRTESELGIHATPWDDALRITAESYPAR